jgi:hypothetical protein
MKEVAKKTPNKCIIYKIMNECCCVFSKLFRELLSEKQREKKVHTKTTIGERQGSTV